jgi:hypothetical protein
MSRNLDIAADDFDRAFACASTALRHSLVDHPLLELEAISELADRLAPEQVRRERGDLPLDDRGYVDAGVGPPSETVRGVEHNGFRVSLREIQSDPAYCALIDACLDEIAELLGSREGGMCRRSGYVFVTAPGATTPMHFDPEHSLLLQIRGRKTVYSVPRVDPETIQRELDRYYDGDVCDLVDLGQSADRFELGPGDGVYFPSFVPHWVSNHDGVSVSFSIPFYTRYSERAEYVNRVNKRLRRLGMSPNPPGRSKTSDVAKATLLRSWTKIHSPRERVRG